MLQVKNRANSTLAAAITATDTSLTVATGEGDKFPTSNFHITIDDEILLCTSRTGDTFTVERAKEGTTAAAHSAGAKVELRITAGIIQELQDAIKWKVVSEVTVASNVSYVDFTGLDINTDKAYILFVNLKNTNTSGNYFYLYINEDYTNANYYNQLFYAAGSGTGAGRENNPGIVTAGVGEGTSSAIYIFRDAYGQPRCYAQYSYGLGSGVYFAIRALTKTSGVSNITSIRFQSYQANGIGAGSNFVLCKIRG